MSIATTQQNPVCPACGSKDIIKKGKRCNRCKSIKFLSAPNACTRFTGEPGKNKTYPLKIILESISTFNLGYSLTETQQVQRQRFHRRNPERTISSWLAEYGPLATYSRLRTDGKKLFAPDTIIRTINFDHQQVYRHQIHRAKLKILLDSPLHSAFAPLTRYWKVSKQTSRTTSSRQLLIDHRSSRQNFVRRSHAKRPMPRAPQLSLCQPHRTTRSDTRHCNASCW